jgi:hypothetical protein
VSKWRSLAKTEKRTAVEHDAELVADERRRAHRAPRYVLGLWKHEYVCWRLGEGSRTVLWYHTVLFVGLVIFGDQTTSGWGVATAAEEEAIAARAPRKDMNVVVFMIVGECVKML